MNRDEIDRINAAAAKDREAAGLPSGQPPLVYWNPWEDEARVEKALFTTCRRCGSATCLMASGFSSGVCDATALTETPIRKLPKWAGLAGLVPMRPKPLDRKHPLWSPVEIPCHTRGCCLEHGHDRPCSVVTV